MHIIFRFREVVRDNKGGLVRSDESRDEDDEKKHTFMLA
jgi:hypothetical protein